MGIISFEKQSEKKSGEKARLIPESPEYVKKAREIIEGRVKLKLKEYSGEIKQKELEKSLYFDFSDALRDNPPIEGCFSPEEELKKIRQLPKDKKGKALESFKDKLVRQREAWAQCRVFIERYIEFDHDVPQEKLLQIVEQFGQKYGFTDSQKQIAEGLLDNYYITRKRALEIREQFPDDVDLVNELTKAGFEKTASFNVSVGPMTIDITADRFDAGRIYHQSKDAVVSFRSNGFAAQSSHKNPILYIVLNRDKVQKSTLPHEYEHQKNRLFRTIFDREPAIAKKKDLWEQYRLEQEPETKKILLEAYFRLKRQRAFNQAKDEFFAIKKGMTLCSYDIFFEKGGAYDYLGYLRDWEEMKGNQLWQEVSQKVLVDEYRTIIENAIKAFDDLMQKGGYSEEEAIALLTDKSLPDWPKAVRRQLEAKEKPC